MERNIVVRIDCGKTLCGKCKEQGITLCLVFGEVLLKNDRYRAKRLEKCREAEQMATTPLGD